MLGSSLQHLSSLIGLKEGLQLLGLIMFIDVGFEGVVCAFGGGSFSHGRLQSDC